MIDTGPKATSAGYYGATPITEEELLENFERTIDRCVSGETFVVLRGGEPAIYMVPYDEYQALQRRAERV
jgi:PHD/YefM family antitoxin component YafN of YafNO toxin-antitoxin module